MARADSVWVPEDQAGPLGAFTVKHEFVRWLRSYFDAHPFNYITAKRFKDGRPGRAEHLTRENLKEMLK